MAERLTVVKVENLHKSFRVPSHRMETLKERAVHPFTPIEYTTLHALRGISFNVADGEFLGIAGRNGSGKTTLLKLLASIYRADKGRIWLAGRLAPFIELGVGFNANLTARENIRLNGVMMGLSPREAQRRYDSVLEFAELEDFAEMKLKNYSTGMNMRLAFSVMVHAEADLMLIDEVLAVGDASFAQKCMDTLRRLRREGRTILLVTHDVMSLESFCDRAILIENGVIDTAGEPDEIGRRYLKLNFAGPARLIPMARDGAEATPPARIVDAWLENPDGERPRGFEHGTPIHLTAVIEATEAIDHPGFGFDVCTNDGTRIFAVVREPIGGRDNRLEPGERVRFRARISNPLTPGSYVVNCSLWRGTGLELIDVSRPAAELIVWGPQRPGYVEIDWEGGVDGAPEPSTLERAIE
jgi:ABC-type polysaccharide/polyol phosphate transport system ATPase subunit